MYRKGYSYQNILVSIACSERYVNEALANIGVKIPRNEKKRIK